MEFFIGLPFSSMENTAKEEKKAGGLSETWDSEVQVWYSGHLREHTFPASSKLAEHHDVKEPIGSSSRASRAAGLDAWILSWKSLKKTVDFAGAYWYLISLFYFVHFSLPVINVLTHFKKSQNFLNFILPALTFFSFPEGTKRQDYPIKCRLVLSRRKNAPKATPETIITPISKILVGNEM